MTADGIERRKQALRTFRGDLRLFARTCLKIRDKSGALVPLVFNAAQEKLHAVVEEQRRRTGWVRAIVLKGRQQGISTYVAARFYHRASLYRGVNVYILSHEQPASDTLFSMVDRFQRNNPIAPGTGVSNVKQLEFDRRDSRYRVATAGQKEGGRSQSTSHMHASEVAFWANAAAHFAASIQTVPLMPGTEIILESTANGVGGEFYERWQDAVAGRSDYIPVFIPWFLQDEYRRTPPEGFRINNEPGEDGLSEAEYATMFGLDLEQIAWRRSKIAEFRSVRRFNQEYPATPEMAFVQSGEDAFIEPATILRARKRNDIAGGGPLILGVDPAGPGGDRFAVCARRGYRVEWIEWRDRIGPMEAVHWVISLIDRHDPAVVFVDAGGMGHVVIAQLRSAGEKYFNVVRAVNFGARSEFKNATPNAPGPKNRRAEMWVRLREWLELEEGVSIPDMDALQADLSGVRLKMTVANDILLESKDEMRKRGLRSPDLADAMALTFASLRITGMLGDKRTVDGAAVSGNYSRMSMISGNDGWMA